MDLGKLRIRLEDTAITSLLNLYTDKVREGERWYLERVAVLNDTTSNADCEMSIEQRAYSHHILQITDVTAGEWSSERVCVWIFPGERLCFRWDGVTSGDNIKVHLTGLVRFER